MDNSVSSMIGSNGIDLPEPTDPALDLLDIDWICPGMNSGASTLRDDGDFVEMFVNSIYGFDSFFRSFKVLMDECCNWVIVVSERLFDKSPLVLE